MALETGTYISDLVITNPTSTDPKSEGDNHLRLIKATLKATFPNVTGAVSLTQDQLNVLGVSQLAGLRNKIINGKMEISQRGTSFAGILSGALSLDRWSYATVSAAVATISQQSDAPSSNELQNSLRYEVTTADASIAVGDVATINQNIEGYNARDLIGRTFTVSFWVRSSKTGVHCVALTNSGDNRAYVAEYTVNSANTWEKKTFAVSGGLITAGTWNWTSGIGLTLRFALASGSTFHTTAGAWQTGQFRATSSQVNCLDTIGNIFAITGVQLEVGSVATPFEHRPYGMELALCQRYYYREETDGVAAAPYGGSVSSLTTGTGRGVVRFPTPMRARPTALETSGVAGDWQYTQGGSNVTLTSAPTYNSASRFSATFDFSTGSGLTVGQAGYLRSTSVNNTFLAWSAEL